MSEEKLKFINRDTRDHSSQSIRERKYRRMTDKSLKNILLDRFINQYGYDKGMVTATAIIEDILKLINLYYRFTDNSLINHGQMVWHAVPIDEYPEKGKSIAQTKLIPVVLDMITEQDLKDRKNGLYYKDIRRKRVERWTQQAFDQGALLTQLDIAVLMGITEQTAGKMVREYFSLYGKPLPTRGNIQQIGSGQSHKKEIISLYLQGYLVPTICKKTNHSKEAVERYIRDFEAVKLLSDKFFDPQKIALIIRLSERVVNQYLDLIPLDE